MKAHELMTPDPACCTPDDTLEDAARLMRGHDCGAIPVCESTNPGEPVGMITDRDMAVRAMASGQGPDTPVRSCMSRDVQACHADDSAEEVEATMQRHQIRRVPIIDADHRIVGIIAQADLALADGPDEVDRNEVAEVVEAISRPPKHIRPVEAE